MRASVSLRKESYASFTLLRENKVSQSIFWKWTCSKYGGSFDQNSKTLKMAKNHFLPYFH